MHGVYSALNHIYNLSQLTRLCKSNLVQKFVSIFNPLPLLTFASGNVETFDSNAVLRCFYSSLPLAQKYTYIYLTNVAYINVFAFLDG